MSKKKGERQRFKNEKLSSMAGNLYDSRLFDSC